MSYKRVQAPKDQPDLTEAGAAAADSPAALPATVAMPDLRSFPVPAADFLAERAGTR